MPKIAILDLPSTVFALAVDSKGVARLRDGNDTRESLSGYS